ncbi:hypothetical protein K469DRAFT_626581 [Zopfia rhizophila CBS 207.26]|uniref:Uncharacterized protein n=1 Tax=Zopfia rhizophila CBS 207.26 TaxID=1314779 RepID=A0A6A6EE68_9PEZI|nr:hypothetical protein K469DRAFT_626581 [Zopfia rhizophila CBS 207.26]
MRLILQKSAINHLSLTLRRHPRGIPCTLRTQTSVVLPTCLRASTKNRQLSCSSYSLLTIWLISYVFILIATRNSHALQLRRRRSTSAGHGTQSIGRRCMRTLQR